MGTFTLPDLGEGLPDATIREWYIKVGDTVKIDQPLVAVETAKAVVDIPAAFTGEITALKGNPGDIINVGDIIIEFSEKKLCPELESPSSTSQTDVATTKTQRESSATSKSQTIVGNLKTSDVVTEENTLGIQPEQTTTSDAIKAVPSARLIAREFDINLKNITPSGKDEIITIEDVKKALSIKKASSPTLPSSTATLTPLTQAQRGLAQMMTKSREQITPATLIENADLHAWSKDEDITVRLLQSIIAALKVEPILNAYYYHDQAAYQLNSKINIGVAVDTPKGLYMPVIKDAGALSAEMLREKINYFKQQSRVQTFSKDELDDANIIFSNYGSIIGQYATPTLVPPMVSIIGAGKIYRKVRAIWV